MFEASLKGKFERIFQLKRTTFETHGSPSDIQSDSKQQECLFIEIIDSRNVIKDGKAVARVTGRGSVFCQNEKLPYAYFSKSVAKAEAADTKDIFFYDLEQHDPIYLNIARRSFSFIYLFSTQYDPNLGILNELEVTST